MDASRTALLDQGLAWVEGLALGDWLVMAAAYGSLLGTSFRPGVSDLNLLLVVEDWQDEAMAQLAQAVQQAAVTHRIRAMVVFRSEFVVLAHLFPLKFHAMIRRHRVLKGENLFEELALTDEEILRHARVEMANVMLKLRRAYLHGQPDARMVAQSILRFLPQMRDTLRSLHQLQGGAPDDPLEHVAAEVGRSSGFQASGFLDAWALREQRDLGWDQVCSVFLGVERMIQALLKV